MTHIRRRSAGLASMLAATALALTACGSDSDNTEPADPKISEASTQDAPGTPDEDNTHDDPDAALKDLYNDALDSLDPASFDDPDGPTVDFNGQFEYALVDVTGDGTQDLLVKALGSEFSAVRVLVPADDNSELIEPGKVFHEGAGSGGGARMAVETSGDGGVIESNGSSASGEFTTVEWEFDGTEMQEGQSWQYRSDQMPADMDAEIIDWTSVDDRGAIGRLGGKADAPEHGDGPNPDRPTKGGDSDSSSGSEGANGGGDQSAAALANNPDQVGGTCGQMDGATVTAGDATSCGFAMVVAQEALQSGSWEANVSADPSDPTAPVSPGASSVTASSPTTGETYQMQCTLGSDMHYVTCTGGNNAMVRVQSAGSSNFGHLVN